MRFLKSLFLSFLIVWAFSCENSKKDNSKKTPSNPPKAPTQTIAFDYIAPIPSNGDLYAAIELGAVGLNYFVVEIDQRGNWITKKSSFSKSDLIHRSKKPEKIANQTIQFLSEIRTIGVPRQNVYMVASASVKKHTNLAEINQLLKKQGVASFDEVSLAEEAKYGLLATVPREFIRESFIVDIGSGSGKLSWIERSDTMSLEIPGSKYFLSGEQDTTVFRKVRAALLQIPKKNRNLCFILGGVVHEFAKPATGVYLNRYQTLKPPNLYKKNNKVLKAGNVIYSALYLDPTYAYVFDTQSNFSIGYLKSKARMKTRL